METAIQNNKDRVIVKEVVAPAYLKDVWKAWTTLGILDFYFVLGKRGSIRRISNAVISLR